MDYIFYHSSDNDGKFSGELVKYILRNFYNNQDTIFVPWNYGANYDIFSYVEINGKPENIYMVDVSILPSDMRLLLDMGINVTWIDHHLSAYQNYKDNTEFEFMIKDGVVFDKLSKKEIGYCSTNEGSAAKLVFNYKKWNKFITNELIPEITELVSTWDTFDQSDDEKWEKAITFNLGSNVYDTNPNNTYDFWQQLFVNKGLFNEVMKSGEIIKLYKNNENHKTSISSGVLEWEGIRFTVVNGSAGSLQIEEASYLYNTDCQMTFSYSIPHKNWRVSMYAFPDTDIDLTPIARKYNGGGHSHSCGFSCDELPFDVKEISYSKEIWN